MNTQKQIAVIINALAIFAVVFLNRNSFISLIAITLIMVLNFWNLLQLKEKKGCSSQSSDGFLALLYKSANFFLTSRKIRV